MSYSTMAGNKIPGYQRVNAYSPGQNSILDLLTKLIGGMGAQGGEAGIQHFLDILSNKPEAFQAFEAPYKRQFEEQVIPGIAEQFAGQGAMSSSAFPLAAAQAGKGLTEDLASMRAGLQQNAASSLLGTLQGLSSLGLGAQPYGYLQKQQKAPSFLSQFGSGLGQGAGSILSSILPFLGL